MKLRIVPYHVDVHCVLLSALVSRWLLPMVHCSHKKDDGEKGGWGNEDNVIMGWHGGLNFKGNAVVNFSGSPSVKRPIQ